MDFGQGHPFFVVVGECEAKLAVHLGLVGWVCLLQDGQKSAEGVDHGVDFVSCHAAVAGVVIEGGESGVCQSSFLLDVVAPGGNQCGVRSGFECRLVASKLAVTLCNYSSGAVEFGGGVGLGVVERGERVREVLGCECFGQPCVQWCEHGVFA
ncbi:MAG TPA: hypothetical protein VGJ13_02905 [Pseudonocardiaceae bacterium]